MIVADTSALIAFFDSLDPDHGRVVPIVEAERTPIAVSPLVCAEIDYLVTKRLGAHIARRVLAELASGAFDIAGFGIRELKGAAAVLDRFPDRRLGLTDASLLDLADRLGTATILTLDRRDFDGLVRSDGTPLVVLP